MKVLTTEIREDDVVNLEGTFFKVVGANLHTGGGKTGAMVHAKLRDLNTGHVAEKRLATTERLEKIAVERVEAQFLYEEADSLVFMNNATFEQLYLKRASLGQARSFLKEGSAITLQVYEGRPIAVDFPDAVEFKVASTGEGLRGDTTYKEAVLENEATVMVPQFIRSGDVVRIDVETGEFLERVLEKTGPEKQVYKPPEKPGAKKP